MNTPQILQQLGGRLSIPPQIRQMITMIKSAGNPQLMLNQLIQNNPQVMQIVQKYGSADKAFYALAEERGINPQEIIDLLK